MTTQIENLVGLTEIADRCNVSKNVASGWTRKHTFPEIKLKLAMGPMWDWDEVRAHLYGDERPQRHYILCAHCSGNAFLEAEPHGYEKTGGRITCADCNLVSRFDVVIVDNDHFFNGLSLNVTKEENA
jgi:hypothetical protein